MKWGRKNMIVRCKKWLIGIIVLLCGVIGSSVSCFAAELKVDRNLINCVKNGYYNSNIKIL